MIIKVFDYNRNALTPITEVERYQVTEEINVLAQLDLLVPQGANGVEGLAVENYLQTPEGEFVIKSVKEDLEGNFEVFAIYNVEDLTHVPADGERAAARRSFHSWFVQYGTPTNNPWSNATARWTNRWAFQIETADGVIDRRFWLNTENGTLFEHIVDACQQIGAEFKLDNINRVCHFYCTPDGQGNNNGAAFFDGLNISEFEIDSSSEDVVTVLCPIGKDGLRLDLYGIDGWIEDTRFFPKRVPGYVNFDDLDNEDDLYDAAAAYLQTVNKARVSYKLTVADLARMGADYGSLLAFGLGDTITFSARGRRMQYRIVKITRDLNDPEHTAIEVSTVMPNLATATAADRTKQRKAYTKSIWASEKADEAQTTATEAQETANDAQTAATEAGQAATAAGSLAAGAQAAAASAQSTANSAQSAASAAQSTANAAQSTASAAQSTAAAAQEAADAKTEVVYSATEPTAAAYKAGDVWNRTEESAGVDDPLVVETLVHDGATWAPTLLAPETIGNTASKHMKLSDTALTLADGESDLAWFKHDEVAFLEGAGTLKAVDVPHGTCFSIKADEIRISEKAQGESGAALASCMYLDGSSVSIQSAVYGSVHTPAEVVISTDEEGTQTSIDLNADAVRVNGQPIGGGGGGSLAACSANNTTSGTVPTSNDPQTVVTLNRFNVRTDASAFSFSGGGIKCEKAGIVQINASIYLRVGSSSAATGTSGCYVRKNGTEIASNYSYTNNAYNTKGCTKIIEVAAGDVITLCSRTSAAGLCYPGNVATYLEVVYLS